MAMIKFNLNRTYKLIQEGERILEITECSATPSGYPTEMKWTLKDVEDGAVMNDKCNFTTTVWKISNIASAVIGAKDGEEMDVTQLAKALVGAKIKCEIVHTQGTKAREDGTFPTFCNIKRVIGKVEDGAPIVENTTTPTAEPVQSDSPRTSILAGL